MNRQERYWLFDLYPDNDFHLRAIKMLILMPNTIIMLHNRSINPDTGEFLKPHYHCIYDCNKSPWYLWALIDKLGLDREKDSHLFGSLKQYEFKRLKDYIIYLTHYNTDKPDKYDPILFQGGLRKKAINIVENYSIDPDVRIYQVLKEIKYIFQHNHIDQYNEEIYDQLYNKFGNIVYKKWSFLLSFINDYRSRYIGIN